MASCQQALGLWVQHSVVELLDPVRVLLYWGQAQELILVQVSLGLISVSLHHLSLQLLFGKLLPLVSEFHVQELQQSCVSWSLGSC